MTLKIDFYLAQAPTFEQCHALCYTLTLKAFQTMQDISILFNTLESAQQFSHRLWCHQPDSFIPHDIDQNINKIDIYRPSHNTSRTQYNMQTTQDTILDDVNHLIQIVPNNETDKQHARALYKKLSALGHQITVHKDA